MADDERAQADAARARTGFAGPIPTAGEAARVALRHGDFTGIRTRLQLGIPLTPEEIAALDALDRGDKLKRGPKDPATDAAETVVCWRWLVEREGLRASDAHSLLAEMMNVTPDVIRARVKRCTGLARNLADLSFDRHLQSGAVPALLQHRGTKGHCRNCGKVKCRCDPAPRPAFLDTLEGRIIPVLMSFWQAVG